MGTALQLTFTRFPEDFFITVYELVGGHQEVLPTQIPDEQWVKPTFKCIQINKNEEDIWVLDEGKETMDARLTGPKKFDPNNTVEENKRILNNVLGAYRPIRVEAAEVKHNDGVQTFGYTLTEEDPLPKVDLEKLVKHKLSPGPKVAILKHMQPVLADDEKTVVKPEDVLILPGARGRKVTILGDNSRASAAMRKIARRSDVVVHEATLPDELKNTAVKRRHSTPSMAVDFAHAVNTKLLLLTHFSARSHPERNLHESLEKDQTYQNRVKKIIATRDFMTVRIPHGGFNENDVQCVGEDDEDRE